jgi:hypothetical protein
MASTQQSDAAAQLRALSKALVREKQLQYWQKELAEKFATLTDQQRAAEREFAEVQEVLDADPALTAVARQMMEKAVELQGTGDREFSVYNPKYVTSEDKQQLLLKILRDHHTENPDADGMSYAAIKRVLENRYKIQTASAGMFFRKELSGWQTRGGNKNKEVLLDLEKILGTKNKDES